MSKYSNVLSAVGTCLGLVLMSLLLQGARYPDCHGMSTPGTNFEVYVPEGLDRKKRYPWLLGFDPNGDAGAVINVLQPAADRYHWIVVASKNSNNGVPFDPAFAAKIWDTIQTVERTFPVDPARLFCTGMSGGGSRSHRMACYYPSIVSGVITNCGVIQPDLLGTNYPHGKVAVFLSSPTDFNYKLMRENDAFLRGKAWDTKWLEFSGGHAYAPPEFYMAAVAWLSTHKPSYQPPPDPAKQVATLKDKLAQAEKSAGEDASTTMQALLQLANFYRDHNQLREAEPLYNRVLSTQEKLFPADSPELLGVLSNLGQFYATQSKYVEAEPLLRRAVAITEKITPAEPAKLASSLEQCAKVLYRCNKIADADAMYARLKELRSQPNK